MELMKGPAAIDAGIAYLDCEEYRFSVKNGGRTWSVYGSPVSRSTDVFSSLHNFLLSGNLNLVDGRSITKGPRLTVGHSDRLIRRGD
jgi:hypothetical protein